MMTVIEWALTILLLLFVIWVIFCLLAGFALILALVMGKLDRKR